jgi:hypothetical protein
MRNGRHETATHAAGTSCADSRDGADLPHPHSGPMHHRPAPSRVLPEGRPPAEPTARSGFRPHDATGAGVGLEPGADGSDGPVPPRVCAELFDDAEFSERMAISIQAILQVRPDLAAGPESYTKPVTGLSSDDALRTNPRSFRPSGEGRPQPRSHAPGRVGAAPHPVQQDSQDTKPSVRLELETESPSHLDGRIVSVVWRPSAIESLERLIARYPAEACLLLLLTRLYEVSKAPGVERV